MERRILYGNDTDPISTSSSLTYNGTTFSILGAPTANTFKVGQLVVGTVPYCLDLPLDKFVSEYGTKNQYGNLTIGEESEHFSDYEKLKQKFFSNPEVIEAGNKFSNGVNEMLSQKVEVNTVKLNLRDLDKIEYLCGDDLDKIEYFLDV